MNPLKDEKYRGVLKKTGIFVLGAGLFFICSGLLYVTKQAAMPIEEEPVRESYVTDITNANLEQKTEEAMKDYWTLAVFGVDSRNGELDRGTNSDTQMIVTIDRNSGEIRIASVYRDTFLLNNLKTENYGKINAAYMEGGAYQNVVALNANLDLSITDYVSFSWKAVADAINLLGGIDLEITESEFAFINSFITETASVTGLYTTHLEKTGYQHLDGVQAVAYCRLRLMDSDFARTERQRKVVELVLQKARNESLEGLLQVLMTVLPQVSTSIGFEDLSAMAQNISKYHITETTGFPGSYEAANLGKKGSCVIPNTLESNVEQLHRFLYQDEDYTCSEKVREIGKEILKQAVRN